LRWSHVEWPEQRFTFLKTKNRRDHMLPFTGMVQEIFERRLAAASNSSRVFGTVGSGRRLGNVGGAVRRLRKATGVYFTPHDLRRWTATALEQAGVGVYTIKGVLNHRSGCRGEHSGNPVL
jgi:integrase